MQAWCSPRWRTATRFALAISLMSTAGMRREREMPGDEGYPLKGGRVVRAGARDPLGYDTSDRLAAARRMARDALSGANRAEIQAEAGRVAAALREAGLLPPERASRGRG